MNNVEVLFIHIEKCAGSSIRQMLYDYYLNIYDKHLIYNASLNNEINLCTSDDYLKFTKFDYKVFLAHCNYNTEYFPGLITNTCLSIVCVRNPIYRILSHYYYFDYSYYKKKFSDLGENDKKKIISINGRLLLLRLSNKDLDYETDYECNYENAKRNVDNTNCIIIFENIDNDLKTLNKFLNHKYNSDFKMTNIVSNANNITYDIDDLKYVNDNLNLIADMEIYNYIINLDVQKRFK